MECDTVTRLNAENEALKAELDSVNTANAILKGDVQGLQKTVSEMEGNAMRGNEMVRCLFAEREQLKIRLFALECSEKKKDVVPEKEKYPSVNVMIQSMKAACDRDREFYKRRYDEVLQGASSKKTKVSTQADSRAVVNPTTCRNATQLRQALEDCKRKAAAAKKN